MIAEFFPHVIKRLINYDVMEYPVGLREIDGLIFLAMATEQRGDSFYIKGNEWPVAIVRDICTSVMPDMIQVAHPNGGWIIMAAVKVPQYTLSYDEAFKLLPKMAKWSISETGFVKVKFRKATFKQRKMLVLQMSLCVSALMAQELLLK